MHLALLSIYSVARIPAHLLIFMEKTFLTVSVRDKAVSAKNLRREGKLPVEFYGHGVQNMSLTTNYGDFRRMFKVAGTNTVIDMEVEGNGKKSVLVHRVDRDPVTGNIQYVEVINVRMDEEITTMIPLRLEGQAPAVKELGLILVQNMDEVEVTCLPAYLPHELTVSLDSLVDINSGLYVSDIKAPANVKIVSDPEQSLVSLSAPQEEIVEPVAEVDVSAVEVTSEKKEGEEGAEEKKEE